MNYSSSRRQRNYGTNSLTETFLTLKPTLSPATAPPEFRGAFQKISVVKMQGAKVKTVPGLMMPVSTRPTGTLPIPPIFNMYCGSRRRGFSLGREGGRMHASKASQHSLVCNWDAWNYSWSRIFNKTYHQLSPFSVHWPIPCTKAGWEMDPTCHRTIWKWEQKE